MANLQRGSRGPEVVRLQKALNANLKPSPNLVPDGVFGGLTDMAVRRFQTEKWLVVDGIAGQCTQNAAYGLETYAPILHSLAALAQPTNTTCWATSTAMINSSNVPAVIAKTPANLLLPDGSLRNSSETDNPDTTGVPYAQVHNLAYYRPMSWTVAALRDRLRTGALMFDMLWRADQYVQGLGSSGHMIVVVGIRGDDDPTGKGTTLRIHDPWPPNVGAVYSQNHFRWMQEVPTRTYRVFQSRQARLAMAEPRIVTVA